MSDCGCDQSGARTFCMHHCQDAFDALEAAKTAYPDPIAAIGFSSSLVDAVGKIVHDFDASCAALDIDHDDGAVTLFIDGLMMGVLLAARAPQNHARHVLAEVRDAT